MYNFERTVQEWWRFGFRGMRLEKIDIAFAIVLAVKVCWTQTYILGPSQNLLTAILIRFVSVFLLWIGLLPLICRLNGVRAVVYIVTSMYLAIHVEYYMYFGRLFNIASISSSYREANSVLLLGYSLHKESIILLGDFWLAILAEIYLRSKPRFCLLNLMAIMIVLSYLYAAGKVKSAAISHFGRGTVMRVLGFIPYEIAAAVDLVVGAKKIHWGSVKCIPPRDSIESVVLIQVESLDAKLIWDSENGVKIMPKMEEIAKTAIIFPKILAFHDAGGSSDADFSMEFSVPPAFERRALMMINDGRNSIPNQLNKTHKTAMFHANNGWYFGRGNKYKIAGFDELNFLEEMKLEIKGWGGSDGDMFDYIMNWYKDQTKPVFVHVITLSTHEPFRSWISYYHCNEFQNSKNKDLFCAFHYADSVLSQFITSLRSVPHTWVLVTGDHTPSSAAAYPSSHIPRANGIGRFEFVPLLIFPPTPVASRSEKRVHSFLDISPTILFASGAGGRIMTDGENLLSERMDANIRLEDNTFISKESLWNMANRNRK